MSTREDRIKGVLLGQAAGDALGVPYETGKPVPPTGAIMEGGGYGFEPGEFSDDTQQAICVCLGRSEPYQVAANLIAWYGSRPKDVGGQTRAVVRRARTPRGLVMASRACASRLASLPVPRGWDPGTGNGSLMRTGPVCLPCLGDRYLIAVTARKVSDLTHADPWSGDACVLWSLAIDSAISAGYYTTDLVSAGLAHIPQARREFWRLAILQALSSAQPSSRNGSAVGCFKAALHAVAHAGSLEDGLQLAVAAGGDTDTVAAVAGALLGALHGASSVPAAWRSVLHGCGVSRTRMGAADLEQLALQAAGSGAAQLTH